MADDKRGREDQARDDLRRQRERAIAEELERGDEPEPPVEVSELAALETDLESLSFPATGAEVVAAAGDREVQAADGSYAVAELVPDAEAERFEKPGDVRARVQRPTIAGAMKRVVEAVDTLPNVTLSESQRGAYQRTFRELEDIDVVDEDEGIRVVADWVVEYVREKERVPGSRDVRRRAAKYCRANGYEVRNDEWLGV